MGRASRTAVPSQRKRAAAQAVKILRGQLGDPGPEERLWLAVIEQAVREAHGEASGDAERRAEAREWLDSTEFDEVARVLGLHPPWARRVINKLDSLRERCEAACGGERVEPAAPPPAGHRHGRQRLDAGSRALRTSRGSAAA